MTIKVLKDGKMLVGKGVDVTVGRMNVGAVVGDGEEEGGKGEILLPLGDDEVAVWIGETVMGETAVGKLGVLPQAYKRNTTMPKKSRMDFITHSSLCELSQRL